MLSKASSSIAARAMGKFLTALLLYMMVLFSAFLFSPLSSLLFVLFVFLSRLPISLFPAPVHT